MPKHLRRDPGSPTLDPGGDQTCAMESHSNAESDDISGDLSPARFSLLRKAIAAEMSRPLLGRDGQTGPTPRPGLQTAPSTPLPGLQTAPSTPGPKRRRVVPVLLEPAQVQALGQSGTPARGETGELPVEGETGEHPVEGEQRHDEPLQQPEEQCRGRGWRRGADCSLNTRELRLLSKKHGLPQYGAKAELLQRLLDKGVTVPGAAQTHIHPRAHITPRGPRIPPTGSI